MRLSESRSMGLRGSGQIDTRESRLMFLRFHKVGDDSIMFEFLDLRLFIGSSEVVNCDFISLGIGFWILVRTPVLTQTMSLPMMVRTF